MTTAIENCRFDFICPRRWEELAPLKATDRARHCDTCDQTVYLCTSNEDLDEHAPKGHCVAVRFPDPAPGDRSHYLGAPALDWETGRALTWE